MPGEEGLRGGGAKRPPDDFELADFMVALKQVIRPSLGEHDLMIRGAR